MTDDQPSAIPAATLVILRDGSPGTPPDLLMVERAATMAFAAGALVFPGGRVDPGDRALAERLGGDRDDTAARLAAIRETIEEVGLAIGVVPPPSTEAVARVRRELAAGAPLAAALAGSGLRPDPAALTPFARWRPAHRDMRIFDTRFFLARLPHDTPDAAVDGTENVRLFWASAAAVLADLDAGRARAIYPTRRNLERLARFASFADAAADAAHYPIETVTPWIERRGGVDHLCIPDHLGYPITAEPLAGARRG